MLLFRVRSSPSALLLLSMLCVYCCCLLVLTPGAEAVDVGESDARRHLLSAASGSGAGVESACPTATTLAASNATAASAVTITSASSDGGATCKSEVVKSAVVTSAENTSHVLLDVHAKGVVVVKSVPADVQILNLSSNSIKSLDEVSFPKTLLSLDLSSNALTTLENVSFPSSLTTLNISRNPIASLKSARFPSSLVQLDLTRTKLTAINNFTFHDALLSLNLSGNAIKKISGVAFPSALAQLNLNIMSPVTSSDVIDTGSVFEEFEVRQSDADNFAKLKVFNVAATMNLICSDTRAKRIYVQNTMLCVLANEIFSAKYGDISSSDNPSGSDSGAAPLGVLDEDIHQNRSWFLIIAAATLGGFVGGVFIIALCRAWGRCLLTKKEEPKPQLQKQRSKSDRNRRQTRGPEDEDDGKLDKLV